MIGSRKGGKEENLQNIKNIDGFIEPLRIAFTEQAETNPKAKNLGMSYATVLVNGGVESDYDFAAQSPAGAEGFVQFLKDTGLENNISIKSGIYDGRRNPIEAAKGYTTYMASLIAAIDKLHTAHPEFSTGPITSDTFAQSFVCRFLAQEAYNQGLGRITKLILEEQTFDPYKLIFAMAAGKDGTYGTPSSDGATYGIRGLGFANFILQLAKDPEVDLFDPSKRPDFTVRVVSSGGETLNSIAKEYASYSAEQRRIFKNLNPGILAGGYAVGAKLPEGAHILVPNH